MIRRARGLPAAEVLRLGIVTLVTLGIVGTTVELLFLGHFGSVGQSVVWPAIAALTVGVVGVARYPSARTIAAARWIAIVVALVALVGIWFHVQENLAAGPLDRKYAATWDTLPALDQWWLASTGGVGPAPILAPSVLLQLGLGLLLSTVRHPALAELGAAARAPVSADVAR